MVNSVQRATIIYVEPEVLARFALVLQREYRKCTVGMDLPCVFLPVGGQDRIILRPDQDGGSKAQAESPYDMALRVANEFKQW